MPTSQDPKCLVKFPLYSSCETSAAKYLQSDAFVEKIKKQIAKSRGPSRKRWLVWGRFWSQVKFFLQYLTILWAPTTKWSEEKLGQKVVFLQTPSSRESREKNHSLNPPANLTWQLQWCNENYYFYESKRFSMCMPVFF